MAQKFSPEETYGRRVWFLLHSNAAYYPNKPSEEKQQAQRDFIEGFMEEGIEYADWGKSFMAKMEQNPLDVSSKEAHAIWLCKHHNLFNADLGKEMFPCEWPELKKRWGPGGGQ